MAASTDPHDHPPSYRASMIGDDHRVATFRVILAGSDIDAVEQARQLINGRTLELWDRSRFIVKFTPQHPQPEP